MGEAAENLYVPEPGKVAIRDEDGSVSTIRQGDLARAVTDEGARPATEAEYFGAKHGTAGTVAAAAVGAGRGASFGLFDPAFIEATRAVAGDEKAEEYRNTMRLLKESHGDASLGGEIAGAVAPALFGAPPAQAAGALGEGLFARGAARFAAAAPRAIGEGVAIGLGNQLSEDTLHNHKLAGEAYLSAGAKGGVLGLLLGAGGGAALGAVGDRVGGLFGKGLARAEEGAGIRAESAVGERLTRLEEKAGAVEETAAQKGPVSKWLDNASDIQAFKGATNAKTGDIRRLGIDVEAQEGVEARLGKMLKDEGLTGPLVTQAEGAKRVTAKLNEVGKSFKGMYAELDQAAQRPSMSTIASRFNEEVRIPNAGKLYGDLEVKPAEDLMRRLQSKGGEINEVATQAPTFTELWRARQEIDGQLRKAYARVPGMPVPPGEEGMRALRGIVNDELNAAADRASTELGSTVGDRLRLANQMYADLSTVNKIATHQAAAIGAAPLVSLTDVIGASTGGAAGVAMAGLNMVRRKFGNQLASHVLEGAAKMETIQRAATKLDDLISSGTKSFVSNGKDATRAIKPVTTAEVRALREATRTPEQINARIAEHLGDLPKYAPKVAQQVSTTASRAAAWLQHALPKEQAPIGPVFNRPKDKPLSDTQLIKARATIETVNDGSIVVDRLREGRLTAEHVAALKYVHPETYAQISKYLGDHAAELRPQLTVQQQFQLSMLFGQPITEAMLPENRRAFQASFSQGNQAPGKGGSGGGLTGGAAPPMMNDGPVRGGGTSAMATDRLEAGPK